MREWVPVLPRDGVQSSVIHHHSMDGVLFHVCSLNGLWLIHDNYPSSIPVFYNVLDTASTAWNEAYIMLVSCIDYALDMTCIQSVSQCFIVCGIL